MWEKFAPYAQATWYGTCTVAANALSWYPMGDVRTHNSRMDSRRMFKLGGGVDHVTRHVRPLTKVKRSKVM